MVDNSDRQQIVNMADQDYTYTEQLGLALYGDETPADFRNGHNFNMRELDKDYGEIKQTAQAGVDAAAKAQESVDNVQKQLQGLDIDSVEDAQNLLQRIENTETTANNNTKALDTKANKTDVYTKTESDERYELRSERSHVIWLGDSITAGSGASSTDKQFRKIVNGWYNFTEHDFSKGGAGWIHAASGAGNLATFPLQAQTAIENDSYDHDSIAKIFVLGGVNDFPTNETEATNLYEAVRGTVKNLLAEFKNATIYVGSFLGGELSTTYSVANGVNRDRTVRKNIMTAALAADGGSRVKIADCWNWCGHDFRNYNADLLHPNDTGHRLIAGQVRQMIEGGEQINPTVRYLADVYAFVPKNVVGNPKRVIRLSGDATLAEISIVAAHTIQNTEILSDKHTLDCTIGTLSGWLRMQTDHDSNIIIAGSSDQGADGWYGGTYLTLRRNSTDNSIELHAYVKNPNKEFTAGATITVNCSFCMSTVGDNV